MMDGIKEESVGFLFNVEVQLEQQPSIEAELAEMGLTDATSLEATSAILAAASGVPAAEANPEIAVKGLGPQRPAQLTYTAPSDAIGSEVTETRRATTDEAFPDTSRNAPCPCGSGKKYKRCHGDPRNR